MISFIKTMKLVQGGQNIGFWQQVSSIKFYYTALFYHSIEKMKSIKMKTFMYEISQNL